MADPAKWLREGQSYAANNLPLVASTVVLVMAIALLLALFADYMFRRSVPGRIVPGSIWFALFRQHRPKNATPWVHVRLPDETEVWGFLGDYTPEQSLENRELLLEGPCLQYRRKEKADNTWLPRWAFFALRGEEITWMKVQYIKDGVVGGEPQVVPAVNLGGPESDLVTRLRFWAARRRDKARHEPPASRSLVESHAKVAGHAVHQQLVVFPLGLLVTAVVFDILRLRLGHPGLAVASYHVIGAGVLAGLLAAFFGLVDYLAIPAGTRAKRVGLLHGIGNVVVVVLFALSWLLRGDQPRHAPTSLAFVLALVGATIAIGTGWLGGELAGRLGVGVDPDASLDAPASYTTWIRLGRASATPGRGGGSSSG